MNRHAFFDELVKLGAVSDEDARRALDRAESLEKNKPTLRQVGRYAGLGAVTAPAMDVVKNVVRGEHPFTGAGIKGKLRHAAGTAVAGAMGMGAMPLLRSHLDRRAELGTLKQYIHEHEGRQA